MNVDHCGRGRETTLSADLPKVPLSQQTGKFPFKWYGSPVSRNVSLNQRLPLQGNKKFTLEFCWFLLEDSMLHGAESRLRNRHKETCRFPTQSSLKMMCWKQASEGGTFSSNGQLFWRESRSCEPQEMKRSKYFKHKLLEPEPCSERKFFTTKLWASARQNCLKLQAPTRHRDSHRNAARKKALSEQASLLAFFCQTSFASIVPVCSLHEHGVDVSRWCEQWELHDPLPLIF